LAYFTLTVGIALMNERILKLETGLATSSHYYFGEGIADLLPAQIQPYRPDRCFLVSSRQISELFAGPLLEALSAGGIGVELINIPDGELNKSWATLSDLCEELVIRGATKDSILIALGGGVVGNVVGLAAGLLFRGVRFVEIPTTVMSQTDGTLSNKQAVNGRSGKNQFGIYHAPLFIWADALYPRTEPERQVKSGVVEGIKNVLVSQGSTDEIEALLAGGYDGLKANLKSVLLFLINSKLPIIKRDPSETQYGLVLEYGHTFGHAIEWLSHGSLYHGEAVAIGMCIAAELSCALGHLSRSLVEKHYLLLGELLGTTTRLPDEITTDAIYKTMYFDNKKTGKGLRFLLLKTLGEVLNVEGNYMTAVPQATVMDVMQQFQLRYRAPNFTAKRSDRWSFIEGA
jgi:3-dehydroquinate synthase